MKTTLACGLLLTLTAAPMALADDCDYEAQRQASVDMAGATLIHIKAAAGNLVVKGTPGLARVEVRGEACTSDEDLLDGIQIVTKRSGDTVRILAEVPESKWRLGSTTVRLDLTIEVPADVPLEIDDSSGAVELRNVGPTELEDGSGEIVAEGVAGDLRVEDGSGSIRIEDVAGNVEIEDGSGEIDVRGVRGSVVIREDGSGAIDIRDVDHDVMIREDGSGGIEVREIGGDFTVDRDGSGGIDYRNVAGRVDIPDDE